MSQSQLLAAQLVCLFFVFSTIHSRALGAPTSAASSSSMTAVLPQGLVAATRFGRPSPSPFPSPGADPCAGVRCPSGKGCVWSRFRPTACAPLRGPLGSCGAGPAPFFFGACEPGLICGRGICVVPRGGRCGTANLVCGPGLRCQGTRFLSLCMPPRLEGQWCGSIAFLRCNSGLTCLRNRCTAGDIPRGQPCGGPAQAGRICSLADVCAGPDGEQVCVEGSRRNGPCGADEFQVCREGFRCVARRCKIY